MVSPYHKFGDKVKLYWRIFQYLNLPEFLPLKDIEKDLYPVALKLQMKAIHQVNILMEKISIKGFWTLTECHSTFDVVVEPKYLVIFDSKESLMNYLLTNPRIGFVWDPNGIRKEFQVKLQFSWKE